MNKETILSWLKTTDIPLTVISEKTGVSRKTLYNWINGSEMRKMNYDKVLRVYNEEIVLINSEKKLKGGSDMNMSTDKIIGLYDENRDLRIEVAGLKDKLQKAQERPESTHWETLEYDFICDVKLFRDGFRFGRIINSVTGFDKQVEVLGYTKDEMKSFWDIGVKHTKLSEHPIEKIIDQETQKDIQKQISILPVIFDAMKATVGDHYIPQAVVYIHKQGHHIGAISYNKVVWSSLKVTAKVKFLID